MRRAAWIGLSLAVAVPMAAPPLDAQQAPARRDSVVVKRPLLVADTLAFSGLNANDPEHVLSLVQQLRARESQLVRALANTGPNDVQTRQALSEQLQRVAREAFTVMSVIEARCFVERQRASGFIGINITAEVQLTGREVTVRRTSITSVEPGSPAQRAGLERGDVLVEIAGRDARGGIPDLNDVLEPGRRVAVRVERNGEPREFALVIAPRPETFRTSCPEIERAMQPLQMGVVGRVWMVDSADARGQRQMYMLTPPTPPTPAVSRTPPTPPVSEPVAPARPQVLVFGGTASARMPVSYFAGAQFRTLDDDWRNVLGLRATQQGVLVNEVAPGSAAAQSGLKSGDVIIEIGGAAATSPFVVTRLLSVSEEGQAILRVIRARQQRTVTMRWNQP